MVSFSLGRNLSSGKGFNVSDWFVFAYPPSGTWSWFKTCENLTDSLVTSLAVWRASLLVMGVRHHACPPETMEKCYLSQSLSRSAISSFLWLLLRNLDILPFFLFCPCRFTCIFPGKVEKQVNTSRKAQTTFAHPLHLLVRSLVRAFTVVMYLTLWMVGTLWEEYFILPSTTLNPAFFEFICNLVYLLLFHLT